MHDNETTVGELRRAVAHFVAERQWERFHDPKNLSMAIAIEAAELMEHFQWLRSEELPAAGGEARAAVTEELADVLCFALSFANALDIDVASAVQAKLARNAAKYPADRFRGRFR